LKWLKGSVRDMCVDLPPAVYRDYRRNGEKFEGEAYATGGKGEFSGGFKFLLAEYKYTPLAYT